MERRDFLKMGLLSIPSICLSPDKLFHFIVKELPEKDQLDQFKSKFAGKFCEEIKDGKVLIPEPFVLSLIHRQIHLLAVNSGYLILIPNDKSIKERIKKEIEELENIEPKIQISYLGTTRLRKDGYLFIPEEARELAGLTMPEVVIFGMIDSIEIWNKKIWDDSITPELRDAIERGLEKYGL